MRDASAGGETEDLEALVGRIRALAGPDGRLPAERALAEQLGLSRHRVRQALVRMRADGEGPAPRRRSPGVARGKASALVPAEALVRATNPLELIEVRMVLEPALARLAAIRASPAEIEALLAAAADNGDDADTSRAADIRFHTILIGAARNSLADALYRLVREVGVDTRLSMPRMLLKRELEQHRRIAEAIADRDPDAAERAMRAHLTSVHQRLTQQGMALASPAA